jgi:hypothetical protein
LKFFQGNLNILYIFYRPGRTSSSATGRGILSMQGLSYGVVRVDSENSLTSLTLQDCGQVMPGGKLPCLL